MSFPYYTHLPTELKLQIWEDAFAEPWEAAVRSLRETLFLSDGEWHEVGPDRWEYDHALLTPIRSVVLPGAAVCVEAKAVAEDLARRERPNGHYTFDADTGTFDFGCDPTADPVWIHPFWILTGNRRSRAWLDAQIGPTILLENLPRHIPYSSTGVCLASSIQYPTVLLRELAASPDGAILFSPMLSSPTSVLLVAIRSSTLRNSPRQGPYSQELLGMLPTPRQCLTYTRLAGHYVKNEAGEYVRYTFEAGDDHDSLANAVVQLSRRAEVLRTECPWPEIWPIEINRSPRALGPP